MNSRIQFLKIAIKYKKHIEIDYTNYRNIHNIRVIQPNKIEYEETSFHPGKQFILYAYDPSKKDIRGFACKDIHSLKIQFQNKT